jgi:PPOX class probable F420-dependent enzyme
MAELPDSVREVLEGTNFWHIATINPDGSPQSTPVWVNVRDGKIVVNTALGRKKPRNIENDPRVALSWHGTGPDGGYRNIAIQGRVVESITGDQAEHDIDDLALKYIGQTPYPWRREGEQRVTYLIEPLRILGG